MSSIEISNASLHKGSGNRNNGDHTDTNNVEMSDSSDKPIDDAEESLVVSKPSKLGKCRKSDTCVQQALRSLNRLSTPEEKFAAICAKYADLFDENKKLQTSSKEHQKQITTLTKDKENTRTELMKALFTKDKLENLCRELQRQNKEIRDDSIQKIRDEEQRRKEVSTKFQVTLNEITELMKQDSDKSMKLRDDNIDMTSKLKSICEQYEIREQQIEKMAKQMALESQLYEAKIAKLEMETAAEKEVLLREKQQLLLTLTEYQARFQEYQNIEVTLRNQVALYNNKYEEFEKSLTRSNEVFGGFKSEMENMSNKILKLESETAAWKLRWEKTQKALIEMASEKQKSDQEIVLAAKQMATLHKLCRTLQSERTQLLAKLKQGSLQTESSSNLNLSNENKNKVSSKSAEESLSLNLNCSEVDNSNSKSKTRTQSLQPTDNPLSVPDDGSEAVKNLGISSQNDSNKEIVDSNGLDVAIAQMKIGVNSKEEMGNQDSLSKTKAQNPRCEMPSTDTFENSNYLPLTENKIEIMSPANASYITLNGAIVLNPSDVILEPSTSAAKTDLLMPEITVSNDESALKNSVQKNRKKAAQKKKNKK